MTSVKEAQYQNGLIGRLESEFPGCVILRNDPRYIQGIPDLLILHRDRWAALEVKASRYAETRPNQKFYVNLLDGMSYSAFVYPENEEEIIRDLQSALGS